MEWISTNVDGLFDGNWVDILTILTAIAYAIFMHRKLSATATRKFFSIQTTLCIAHGVALFPLILLSVSTISSVALEALIHSHKVILTVAGLVAIFAILEDRPPA